MIESLLEKLNEADFRDTFKPISGKEHKKRNPKPNKKGDTVKWGKESAKLPDIILTKEPIWHNDKSAWHSRGITPTGRTMNVWYAPYDGRWFTTDRVYKAVN